jgi:UDP-N-acetylglucosamine transferase subunit ALG13
VIFVTVGTQLPFDRLIDAMDAWAAGSGEPVVAQAGPHADAARWPHLDIRTHLRPSEFETQFAAARIVVGHAGIGTILSAQRFRRPLVILPRRASLGEHRNDHQMATAREVMRLPGVHVAMEVGDLPGLLSDDLPPAGEAPSEARDRLVAFLSAEMDRG